jgi:hypothetical protein
MPLIPQGRAYAGTTLVSGYVVQPRTSLLPVAVTATTGGTAHTAGTAVEVSASLPTACQWLTVDVVSDNSNNGADTSTLIEVRTGASLDTVLLRFAAGYRIGASNRLATAWAGPCPIPAGTRVGVAARSTRTSQAVNLSVSTATLPAPTAAPVPYGVDTATSKSSIVLPNPSGTGVPGDWVQVVASTPQAWQGLHLGPQMDANTNVSNGTVDIDVGIGASGSEVVVDTMRLTYNASENMALLTRPFVPALIPAGTRVAARVAQRSAASMPVDLLVHGIPLGG